MVIVLRSRTKHTLKLSLDVFLSYLGKERAIRPGNSDQEFAKDLTYFSRYSEHEGSLRDAEGQIVEKFRWVECNLSTNFAWILGY